MANQNMGRGRTSGPQRVGPADPNALDEQDLAGEAHGRNQLQGNEQSAVQNERQRMSEERRDPLDDKALPDRGGDIETARRTRRGV